MKWISIKDRLPKPSQRVLAIDMVDENPSVEILIFFGADRHNEGLEWSSYTCNTFDPTHWMELPELPNEVDNRKEDDLLVSYYKVDGMLEYIQWLMKNNIPFEEWPIELQGIASVSEDLLGSDEVD